MYNTNSSDGEGEEKCNQPNDAAPTTFEIHGTEFHSLLLISVNFYTYSTHNLLLNLQSHQHKLVLAVLSVEAFL